MLIEYIITYIHPIYTIMQLVKKYTYTQITSKLSGKTVHFTSDCTLFPNFDVVGKVMSCVYSKSGNLLFSVKLKSGRYITVDSKMSNLKFEIIK